MRKNYLILIIIAFPFFLMSCITPGIKETNPIGKVYKDSIKLWEKTIPLPEGEWKVIGNGSDSNDGRNILLTQYELFSSLILLKESETKKVHSILYITVESMRNNSPGYTPIEYFKRKDVHYVVVKNNEAGDAHDAWLINHCLISIDYRGRPALKEVFAYLASNKLVIPQNMILSYHHFTGKYQKSKYLNIAHYSMPNIEYFESKNELNLSSSDWHPLRIDNDPKKMAYIERLKNEGAIMHEKIRVGFGD